MAYSHFVVIIFMACNDSSVIIFSFTNSFMEWDVVKGEIFDLSNLVQIVRHHTKPPLPNVLGSVVYVQIILSCMVLDFGILILYLVSTNFFLRHQPLFPLHFLCQLLCRPSPSSPVRVVKLAGEGGSLPLGSAAWVGRLGLLLGSAAWVCCLGLPLRATTWGYCLCLPLVSAAWGLAVPTVSVSVPAAA
jgi:hypothetical protein